MYEFKNFTQKANKALNIAISSAEEMGHSYIGTEHLLLGLLKEGTGVAATALNEAGLTAEKLEEKIIELQEKKKILSDNLIEGKNVATLDALTEEELTNLLSIGYETDHNNDK